MTRTPDQKQTYAQRRERRLSRLKTAATLLPYYLGRFGMDDGVQLSVRAAVEAADKLIAEVDRTDPAAAPAVDPADVSGP